MYEDKGLNRTYCDDLMTSGTTVLQQGKGRKRVWALLVGALFLLSDSSFLALLSGAIDVLLSGADLQ